MSMNDPISDLLTRIRNAQRAGKKDVGIPGSKIKTAIAQVLTAEGYIQGHRTEDREGKPWMVMDLKYFSGKPVIEKIVRISRPGLRIYRSKDDLPKVLGGLGVSVISTSQGLMTDRDARTKGMGGEVLLTVY
jgi:small subunit ribosomal protein S8